MVDFSILNSTSDTFTDSTPNDGIVIDFSRLDNGFNVQVNGAPSESLFTDRKP